MCKTRRGLPARGLRLPLALLVILLLVAAPLAAGSGEAAEYDGARGFTSAGTGGSATALRLTDAEREWLSRQRTVRFAFDGHFPPYSFLGDSGALEGLAVDVIRDIARRAGFSLEIAPQTVWNELYAAAQSRDVDAVATMGRQPERERWFLFTRPYIFKPMAIVTRGDAPPVDGPQGLAGKRVALVRGYQHVAPLLAEYPAIVPHPVDTILQGLRAVEAGDADAAITFVAAGQYLKRRHRLDQLKFAAIFDRHRYSESIAVRGDWPELAAILDKALASIPAEEWIELERRWIGIDYAPVVARGTAAILLVALIGTALLAAAMVMVWNGMLRREVRLKTAELEGELAERRRTAAALHESERKYRELVENANTIILRWRPDGEITFINTFGLRFFGYDEAELLGRSLVGTIVPESESGGRDLRPLIGRIGADPSGYAQNVDENMRRGGGRVWVSWANRAVRDDAGRVTEILSIGHDITARRQAEEALRLGEERYRAFVGQSSEAICRFEIDGPPIDTTRGAAEQIERIYAQAVIAECNQAFATGHGCAGPAEMRGMRIGQILPRLARENVELLRAFVDGGYRVSGVESREPAPDGTVRHFLSGMAGQLEGGRLVRLWCVKQDISRLKQAEEEVRALNVGLERRIAERTAALEASNRELEAFSYSVSHDLRAPLRAVDGYVRMLLEEFAPGLGDEGRRLCTVIGESAREMGRLIDALLAHSRVGRTAMTRCAIDIEALARSVYLGLTTPADRERIDFRVGTLPPATGDLMLVRQLLANLLANAIKFSSKRERASIELFALRQQGRVVYSLRDNGAGFDMRYAEKLFGVFQRLHSTKSFEGSGVGLAIVQRIVHRHGGFVRAEGEPGVGATFSFSLDGADPQQEHPGGGIDAAAGAPAQGADAP